MCDFVATIKVCQGSLGCCMKHLPFLSQKRPISPSIVNIVAFGIKILKINLNMDNL